ncbi:MAG: GNAT family N-acetyltransferase [Ktedonobacteraceae bacterium]
MNKLTLCEVTRDNWRETLHLAVHPEQQRFIAEYVPIAAIALAKAYIRPEGWVWVPYAFSVNTELVGFTELAYEPESIENYWLFHFFIDSHYQGQGYGKQALHLLLQFIKDQHPRCQFIQLTVHPDNQQAQRLYTNAGFRPAGAQRDGEPVYRLAMRL